MVRTPPPGFLARPAMLVLAGVAFVSLAGTLAWHTIDSRRRVLDQERNFYGVLKIKEYGRGSTGHDYTLIHGRITHGHQLRRAGLRAWPTAYYGPRSGVGLAIRFHPVRRSGKRELRIGVVGLGAGIIAAYANASVLPLGETGPRVLPDRRDPGDRVRFYEINPLVVRWARRHFTFLSDAESRGARVEVSPGDARIVMERQLLGGEPQNFDVLAIDAFSGDAIPVHLLTNECMQVYLGHLREDGVLAVHITNRYLWLAPVVRRLAAENGLLAVLVENDVNEDRGANSSDWMLVTRSREFLRGAGLEVPPDPEADVGPLWTDDFSSLLSILK